MLNVMHISLIKTQKNRISKDKLICCGGFRNKKRVDVYDFVEYRMPRLADLHSDTICAHYE